MIHQWKKSLLEGAAGIFERGAKAVATAGIAEDTVRDLHAKIGDLAVANDFLSRKLKPWRECHELCVWPLAALLHKSA